MTPTRRKNLGYVVAGRVSFVESTVGPTYLIDRVRPGQTGQPPLAWLVEHGYAVVTERYVHPEDEQSSTPRFEVEATALGRTAWADA